MASAKIAGLMLGFRPAFREGRGKHTLRRELTGTLIRSATSVMLSPDSIASATERSRFTVFDIFISDTGARVTKLVNKQWVVGG